MVERNNDDYEVQLPTPIPRPEVRGVNEGTHTLPTQGVITRVPVYRLPINATERGQRFFRTWYQADEEIQRLTWIPATEAAIQAGARRGIREGRFTHIHYEEHPVQWAWDDVAPAVRNTDETVIELTQKQETEMAVRTTKLNNKQAECAAVLQRFVGAGPRHVAVDSDTKSKELHKLLQDLAGEERPEKGILVPEKYIGSRLLADLSNWAYNATTQKKFVGVDPNILERLAKEYAWFCEAWDFEPAVSAMRYYGGEGIIVQTPEIRIPMPAPYPKGYMSCGQIRIRVGIMGGGSWGVEPAGFGPMIKPHQLNDVRTHPHDMSHYYCTGGWELALNHKAAKFDLIGFMDILMEMLTMETSKKRFYSGYGAGFEHAGVGHCMQCGVFQYDVYKPRGGITTARERCPNCGCGVICNTCAKTRSAKPTQYSTKRCTNCTWATEDAPYWWEKAPPIDPVNIPCARCGTTAKTRQQRVPVQEVGGNKLWVCTGCIAPDGTDTAISYAAVKKGGDDK